MSDAKFHGADFLFFFMLSCTKSKTETFLLKILVQQKLVLYCFFFNTMDPLTHP
jgi:hypothetical protein